MRRYMVILFGVSFLLFIDSIKAQNIDSLDQIISSASNDTSRINVQLEIAKNLRKQNLELCRDFANKALEESIEIDYRKGQALAYETIGLTYYLENPDSSVYLWRKSIGLYNELDMKDPSANVTYNCGLALFLQLGRFSEALKDFFTALAYYESIGDKKNIAKCYNPIGSIYIVEDEYEQAEKYLSLSLQMSIEMDDKWGQMRLYNNLGGLYENTKDYDRALEHYKRSLEINREVNGGPNLCEDYEIIMNIGNSYRCKGDYDAAIVILKESVDSLKTCAPNSYLVALNMLAETMVLSELHRAALPYALECDKILEEVTNIDQKKFVSVTLSNIYEGIGNYELSLKYYKRYTAIKDSLFNESKSKEIGKLEAQYEMEKKQEEEKRLEESLRQKTEKEKSRRNNLQFSGIFVFVLLLFAVVFMSGKFSMSEKVAEGLIFFTFLLFFEFCLVLVDPYVEQWSGGEPLFKLLFNAILAAAIFPAHAFFENTLKKRVLKQR